MDDTSEREHHEATQEARREVAAHPEQHGGREERIGSFVGALLYVERRHEKGGRGEKPVGERRPHPSDDDDSTRPRG